MPDHAELPPENRCPPTACDGSTYQRVYELCNATCPKPPDASACTDERFSASDQAGPSLQELVIAPPRVLQGVQPIGSVPANRRIIDLRRAAAIGTISLARTIVAENPSARMSPASSGTTCCGVRSSSAKYRRSQNSIRIAISDLRGNPRDRFDLNYFDRPIRRQCDEVRPAHRAKIISGNRGIA